MRSQRWLLVWGMAATCLLAKPTSAETVCWDIAMALLPSDGTIPAHHRFEARDRLDFISVEPGFLHVSDDVFEERVVMLKSDVAPLTSSEDWVFEIVMRMNAAERDQATLNFGSETTVRDDTKSIRLGLDTDTVGFVDEPPDRWVDGLSVAMDTSDVFHTFRVEKTGMSVELFIDGQVTPSLVLPYDSFPDATSPPQINMFATSIVGTADFDIQRFGFQRVVPELHLAGCPPVVGALDSLTFTAGHGMPGSVGALYLTSLDGVAISVLVTLGVFDVDCVWNLSALVPSGIPAFEAGFVMFGIDKSSGQVEMSDEVPVVFL